jgi:hypothetical protein
MGIRFYQIDRKLFKKTHSSTFGGFTFSPCMCDCTKDYGIGFNFIWFGINIYWK